VSFQNPLAEFTQSAFAHTLLSLGTAFVLGTAIGLRFMGLADDIINLAFGLILGAIAVALALSFGLGGRDAAKGVMQRMIGDGSDPVIPRKLKALCGPMSNRREQYSHKYLWDAYGEVVLLRRWCALVLMIWN
jgi:hypothetical protein